MSHFYSTSILNSGLSVIANFTLQPYMFSCYDPAVCIWYTYGPLELPLTVFVNYMKSKTNAA